MRRVGLGRLRDADRTTGIPIRYQACHPGAQLHRDHRKLGRVPASAVLALELAAAEFARLGVRIERGNHT